MFCLGIGHSSLFFFLLFTVLVVIAWDLYIHFSFWNVFVLLVCFG